MLIILNYFLLLFCEIYLFHTDQKKSKATKKSVLRLMIALPTMFKN